MDLIRQKGLSNTTQNFHQLKETQLTNSRKLQYLATVEMRVKIVQEVYF